MGNRLFQSFSAAQSFAREEALRTGRSPVLKRFGDAFQVSGPSIGDESPCNINSTIAIAKGSNVFEQLAPESLALALQEVLKESVDLPNSNSPGKVDEGGSILVNIPSVLNAIAEYLNCLEEIPYVKSLEYAIEMSSQLADISERLSPFDLGKIAITRARALAAESKNLPSEPVVQRDAQFKRKLIQLNAEAGTCSCGSKMIVREGPYGYFFGCSSFPDCFRSRKLTPKELDFLQ